MTASPNRRILLIDDTRSIHGDFRKILARGPGADLDAVETALFGQPVRAAGHGFDLDSAYQGREGVAMAEAALRSGRPYAMAFVDMRMPPGWDGVETIERLWEVDPQVQVVICTAYSDHPWESVMARLDVRDRLLVVKKPFDLIEVSQLARTLTAKWDLARQTASHIEALNRSHKQLETFAHSLSHDLRAPLTAMRSFSQLLGRALAGSAAGKTLHYLSRIEANAGLAEQLIDDLLFLESVSRAPLTMERVELGDLASELLDEMRAADPQRPVVADIHKGLWANADRNQVRIALRHLLANARKFTPAQQPATIEVGCREDAQGQVAFFVRDQGRGFDMAYAEQLFKMPQRLQRDSELTGSGLGLVVVGRIIGRHGGRVWAESAPDAGSTFYFTLPL
ncbi:ATP-binding protein [Caenimonas soli]|uniref:ATP-binding protein n=1 Tax=Caenimonas soli TaxID=2735555 RepID=UPI0015528350|nr:ATP-binding protein [Caenimonas soli]NPC58619.1 hybrid sensor histidine kinase/response regulator [Caenimonas soli]